MGLSHIAVVASISLAGLMPSSCSKTSPHKAAALQTGTTAAAPSNVRNLGVIQLTNHFETEINLGKGETCRITPRLMGRQDLKLTLFVGTKDADGNPTALSVTQVTTEPGKPLQIKVDKSNLTFTPELVE